MEDYNPDIDPSRASIGIDVALFELDAWQIKLINQLDLHDRKPYQHVYAFVKHKQAMTRNDFQETQEAIRDIMNKESVNSGILMFMHGTYVFTEVPVDLNPLIIKLASGINFNGEVTSAMRNLDAVNTQLGR